MANDLLFEYANLLAAIGRIALGFLLLVELRRLHLPVERIAVTLVFFFLLSGVAALNDPDPLLGYDPSLEALLDLALLGLLVVIALDARRFAGATVAAYDEARWQAAEYERARTDYRSLVEHRLHNPLTAVRGAAQTLRERPGLDDDTRRALLDTIVQAADAIEAATAEAGGDRHEERALRPLPRRFRRGR